MICPNCGSNMSDKRKRCERCGTDLTLYKKIILASNQYYNNGLARAKVRDLSGAIIALRNSLELNKTNTNARNLLGLIYFEMGETVAALSEWVISKHFKPEDNDADEYINKVQSNPTKLDNLNQAIKRYNNALTFAKQGSDDLAIIQLKKVTSLNPHFIRAYHLLALLHMKGGENDKAKKCLIRAGKIDVSNTTTLRYMRELETPAALATDMDANPEAGQSINSSIMPISSYREDKPNIMAFVNLVIGLLIGIAVTAFLIVPTINKNKKVEENKNLVDYNAGLAVQEEKDATINQLNSEKDQLNAKIDQLQAEIDSFVVPEDKTNLYDPLFDATEKYMTELAKPARDRDLNEIADLLAAVDEKQYESEVSKILLNRLREEIYPQVAEARYQAGRKLYNDAKYEEALTEFEKAMTFDPTDDDAVYYRARSYHRLEDFDNAKVYYNIVITDFPNSDRKKNSENYLNQIQG
jgi:tetratricopeptide (TPR) repeat protein